MSIGSIGDGHKLRPWALRVNDAAAYMGSSRSEVYRLLRAGELEAVKHGANTVVLMASIDRYLASLKAAQFRADRLWDLVSKDIGG